MPQPTRSDVHVNRPLTNISVAYIQRATDFIADQVFPTIPVSKQSDRYFTYDKSYWFRSEATERAPGTESAGSGFTIDSTPSYYARLYAVHKDVDDQTRANTDDPLNADRDATLLVTQQMLLKKDALWASTFFKTGVWTNDLTAVTSGTPTASEFLRWDVAGGDPTADVTLQATKMHERTGYRPNVLVITPFVLQKLNNHSLILDRIKYTQRGIVTLDLLAALFGVEKVVVANATNNTAQEGAATAMSFVFGKSALLLYSNPNPSIMQPSAGYTFSWSGLLGAGAGGSRIKRFRQEQIESDRIEAEMAFDYKVVASDCGTFMSGVVS